MAERLEWERDNRGGFFAMLPGGTLAAQAWLVFTEGEWWWRVLWPHRFDRVGHSVDKQQAADAATEAWNELVATTTERKPGYQWPGLGPAVPITSRSDR